MSIIELPRSVFENSLRSSSEIFERNKYLHKDFPYLQIYIDTGKFHINLLPDNLTLGNYIEILIIQHSFNNLPIELVLGYDASIKLEQSRIEFSNGRFDFYYPEINKIHLYKNFRISPERKILLSKYKESLNRHCTPAWWLDREKASLPATLENIKVLPRILRRRIKENDRSKYFGRKCNKCGEYSGKFLWKRYIDWRVVDLKCSCQNNTVCARCKEPFAEHPLRQRYYDSIEKDCKYRYGYSALYHTCKDLIGRK